MSWFGDAGHEDTANCTSATDAERARLGNFVLLRHAGSGAESVSYRGMLQPAPYKVLMLHGWNQDVSAWMQTARRIHSQHRADVLALDFWSHGRSPSLPRIRDHTVRKLHTQVVNILRHCGWEGHRLVICGCSMGASVAMHYAALHRGTIHGLILVAPSGMEEAAWHPTSVGGRLVSWILRRTAAASPEHRNRGQRNWARLATAAIVSVSSEQEGRTLPRVPLLRKLLCRLNFIHNTPTYGISHGVLRSLADLRVTVLLARFDLQHSPAPSRWKAYAPNARLLIRNCDHPWLCTHIGASRLEQDPIFTSPPFLQSRL